MAQVAATISRCRRRRSTRSSSGFFRASATSWAPRASRSGSPSSCSRGPRRRSMILRQWLHLPVRISFRRALAEGGAAFAAAFAFLLVLAPTAPFTRELGVCESGAVRDILAGNLILPHFIPGPMVHVPPLYWWSAAVAVRMLGWTELALRLPALLPAALTCAILYGWMLSRLNREAAFWSAAALLLCHFFLDAARQPRMDSMLALFVTAAAIALERGIRPSISPGTDAPAIDLAS